MNDLPDEKKLVVLFRVEPGCLGPEGANHVEGFCEFAQDQFKGVDAAYVIWKIVPRLDKSKPEMEYCVGVKRLTEEQASKYVSALTLSLDELMDHLHGELAVLIDEYMR